MHVYSDSLPCIEKYMYNSSGAIEAKREIIVQTSQYAGLCMYVCMYAVTLQECNHCFYLTHITSAQLALRKRALVKRNLQKPGREG